MMHDVSGECVLNYYNLGEGTGKICGWKVQPDKTTLQIFEYPVSNKLWRIAGSVFMLWSLTS